MSGRRREAVTVEITAGFLLPFSLLWLLDTEGLLSALLPAALAHEAGHALALRCCGAYLTRLRFAFCGLRMDYGGVLTRHEELFCTLAGPLSGGIYALCAAFAGARLHSEFLLCSAGLSLLLSGFNLRPAPMLDGGRALALLALGQTRLTGVLTGILLLLAGGVLFHSTCGPVLLLAGAYVLIGTCQSARIGIK